MNIFERIKSRDKFLTGFVPGLLLPLLGFYLYFLLFFGYMTFSGFFNHVTSPGHAISVLSLGVILNLALFFAFYQMEMDRAARGVIGSTFIYAFLALYFKVLA
jgi:hypothetical protein